MTEPSANDQRDQRDQRDPRPPRTALGIALLLAALFLLVIFLPLRFLWLGWSPSSRDLSDVRWAIVNILEVLLVLLWIAYLVEDILTRKPR